MTASRPSLYLRAEGVPPIRIKGYPKRRRTEPEEQLDFGRPAPTTVSTPREELTYADFLAAPAENRREADTVTAA